LGRGVDDLEGLLITVLDGSFETIGQDDEQIDIAVGAIVTPRPRPKQDDSSYVGTLFEVFDKGLRLVIENNFHSGR
jgi:hypothetical protein